MNLEHTVNFFSGHDYTLLGTICALNLVSDFKIALNFSAFILFELWDSPPQDSELYPSYAGPTVRILLNPSPFKNPDHTASRIVQTCSMIRLKDFQINEIVTILNHLRKGTEGLYMKPLKKETKVDEASSTDNHAAPLNQSEEQPEIDMLS